MHVVKRGARGGCIVRQKEDRDWFVRALYYLNDSHTPNHWRNEVMHTCGFRRPSYWPEREPLVRVLAWTLLSNHFHLLVEELVPGGIGKYMQRLGGSMSAYHNAKYGDRGSLFQGGYRGKLVSDDRHLRYLAFYILVKNTLEMYPGGLAKARVDFDSAWDWATRYDFSSLRDLFSEARPITETHASFISEISQDAGTFKNEARELLKFHMEKRQADLDALALEPW